MTDLPRIVGPGILAIHTAVGMGGGIGTSEYIRTEENGAMWPEVSFRTDGVLVRFSTGYWDFHLWHSIRNIDWKPIPSEGAVT